MLQRHGTTAQADQAGPDSFTRDEPLLHAVRMAQGAQASDLPAMGAIADFSPVVPVENRAGRLTGRSLTVSIEPGTVVSEDVEVTVSGTITLPTDEKVTVQGSFHVGPSPEQPEARYEVSGPAEVAAEIRAALPRSFTVELVSADELALQVKALVRAADAATASLCENFAPMMKHKVSLVGGYRSATWGAEDAMQEALATFAAGVTRFGSAARPNTSLYSWADLELWRALERAMCRDSGLSMSAWKARRWMLENGTSTVTAADVAEAANVPESAAEIAIQHLSGQITDADPASDYTTNSVTEDWRALAAKAGLTSRQRRVCEARLMAGGEVGTAPWKDVAKTVGYSERTCQRLFRDAKALLAKI